MKLSLVASIALPLLAGQIQALRPPLEDDVLGACCIAEPFDRGDYVPPPWCGACDEGNECRVFCLTRYDYCMYKFTDPGLIGFPDGVTGAYAILCDDNEDQCCIYHIEDGENVYQQVSSGTLQIKSRVSINAADFQAWCAADAASFFPVDHPTGCTISEDCGDRMICSALSKTCENPPQPEARRLQAGDKPMSKIKASMPKKIKASSPKQYRRKLFHEDVSATFCPPCKFIGMCGGDPHFQLWSGEFFDYHAECDLVFLQVPEFGKGLGLDVHIRTKARFEYSYIESAAIKIGDDVLEVSAFGEYRFNGVLGADMPAMMANIYSVTYNQVNKKKHDFNIHLGGNENIVVTAFKDLVSVKMGNSTSSRFGGSAGLMGDFEKGKMLARDGKTIIEDPNEFGQEWQVLETEARLFDTLRAPQHPQVCTPPGAKKEGRRLSETITEEDAAKACETWGEHKDLCVYDVIAMGDLELAEAGAY